MHLNDSEDKRKGRPKEKKKKKKKREKMMRTVTSTTFVGLFCCLILVCAWTTTTTTGFYVTAWIPTTTSKASATTAYSKSKLQSDDDNSRTPPITSTPIIDTTTTNNNNNGQQTRRRQILKEFTKGISFFATTAATTGFSSLPSFAFDYDDDGKITSSVVDAVESSSTLGPIELSPLSPDSKKLFNEGRALESQGNMIAAQRLYAKVTKISPRFVYGYSNLGNTQVALGDLNDADNNYSKAITLCRESSLQAQEQGFGIKKCNDLYVLLLNRGSVRLNTPTRINYKQEALKDLRESNLLRDRPDAVILQNLARAEEINGFYSMADKNYGLAISMTSNEVNPFWLRSSMVKLQLGDLKGGQDLLKRIENRFPDAPEVKAASATFLWALAKNEKQKKELVIASPSTISDDSTNAAPAPAPVKSSSKKGSAAAAAIIQPRSSEDYQIDAQRKFLEIPDRQRLKFIDQEYLNNILAWPPIMMEGVQSIAKVVGDLQ
jgi:tetratricopeptide (TPR) repeat protein